MNSPLTDEDVLSAAVVTWKDAQVLHDSRSWKGRPPAAHFVEVLSSKPHLEQKLLQLLEGSNQLVAAYALLTLKIMKSSALQNLPEDLLQRKEKVTSITGSFKEKWELGALAKHIQKQARTSR